MTEITEIFKPSTEIAKTLVDRLGAMSQDQLQHLDSVITPEIAQTIFMFLPELKVLKDAVRHPHENDESRVPEPRNQVDDTPPKAIEWWQKNPWFKHPKFPEETAAAKAIDVLLDIEGYDKNSDLYYQLLDQRLRAVLPAFRVLH